MTNEELEAIEWFEEKFKLYWREFNVDHTFWNVCSDIWGRVAAHMICGDPKSPMKDRLEYVMRNFTEKEKKDHLGKLISWQDREKQGLPMPFYP